jgi:hypothetical protein
LQEHDPDAWKSWRKISSEDKGGEGDEIEIVSDVSSDEDVMVMEGPTMHASKKQLLSGEKNN